MYSANDIRSTTFETVRKGYSTVDVDSFLNKIAGEQETMQQQFAQMVQEKENEIAAVRAEKDELEEKMLVLADKLEEYRGQENIIRNALLNAERMKESLLSEAQQTADILLRDARNKAEVLLTEAQNQSEAAVTAAKARVSNEESKFLRIQQEVVKFKNSIIELYKGHIDLISNLPDECDIVPVESILTEEELSPVAEEPVLAETAVEETAAEEVPAVEETAVEETVTLETVPEEAAFETELTEVLQETVATTFDDPVIYADDIPDLTEEIVIEDLPVSGDLDLPELPEIEQPAFQLAEEPAAEVKEAAASVQEPSDKDIETKINEELASLSRFDFGSKFDF